MTTFAWKKTVWAALFFLAGAAVFAGGEAELPRIAIASVNLGRGLSRIVMDWSKIQSEDQRQFGLYRSTGAQATSYALITSLNSSIQSYTDVGVNVDTEYHYIVADAPRNKALALTKPRGAREKALEKSHPEAMLSYGNIPGGPIEWNVPTAPPYEGAPEEWWWGEPGNGVIVSTAGNGWPAVDISIMRGGLCLVWGGGGGGVCPPARTGSFPIMIRCCPLRRRPSPDESRFLQTAASFSRWAFFQTVLLNSLNR